jgi:hypothetical protein
MDIHLDGAERSVLKALGFSGSPIRGDDLLQNVGGLQEAELIDTLQGLIMMGYVNTDTLSLHNAKDLDQASFHVNPSYARDLRDALDSRGKPAKKRRQRRE